MQPCGSASRPRRISARSGRREGSAIRMLNSRRERAQHVAAMIDARSRIGTHLVIGGLAMGMVSLVLPAGTFLGAPLRGYELLLLSFASLAGPFRQWQDGYIALASLVNAALLLVLPVSLAWRVWRRPAAVIAGLCAGYVVSFPIVFSYQPNPAYVLWLAAVACSACGCYRLARVTQR